MKRIAPYLIAIVFGFAATPALAQATRTFVSGNGSDANPCSLAAPCRSFQQAHNVVSAGGEVVALDSAGYGTITISKAITITAIGIEASITSSVATPTGIIVNAGAGDVVTIRGLTLISGATSGDGVDINSAKSVTIRDCTIKATLNVVATANGNVGIEVSSIFGKAKPVVMVTGAKLLNNGLGGLFGSNNVQVFVDRTQISGNGTGWQASGGGVVSSYKTNAVNGNGNDNLNGVVQITNE
jgi:hypothetical protein